MPDSAEDRLTDTLARVAPGTALRDGLDRILRGRTGALIVLGQDPVVDSLCTGGFDIGIDFSAPRLRELAKMDGGIVVDQDVTRIVKAGVQLVPDSSIPTQESGTRHRTAQRVAAQTGLPVVTVSASMQIIAIFVGELRHQLEDSESILARATQALTTLERYRSRLDQVTSSLSTQEIEDTVTVRDVALVIQRQEMLRRIAEEIAQYVLELGTDGRLVSLQLQELTGKRDQDSAALLTDYARAHAELAPDLPPLDIPEAVRALQALSSEDLVDLSHVATVLGFPRHSKVLDVSAQPLGFRLLCGIDALDPEIRESVTDHFGGLQSLMAASLEDLTAVSGVDADTARTVREGLGRFAEASLVGQFG